MQSLPPFDYAQGEEKGYITLHAERRRGAQIRRGHIEKQLTQQTASDYCFTIAVNLTRAFFVGRCGSIVPTRPTF